MANHTDEHGKSAPARSTVAKRMRGALKGHKNVARRTEAKKAIYQEGAPIYAHGSKGPNMGSMMKKSHSSGGGLSGPYRSRAQAIEKVGKGSSKKTEVTTQRGKHGMDIRYHRNPHYKF